MYVKYIDLKSGDYSEYSGGDNGKIVLEKNNIFIGKNNSGKSRLMRHLLIHEYFNKYYCNSNMEDVIPLKKSIESTINDATENAKKGLGDSYISQSYIFDYIRKVYNETYLSNETKLDTIDRLFRSKDEEARLASLIFRITRSHDSDIRSKILSTGLVDNITLPLKDIQLFFNYCPSGALRNIYKYYDEIIEQMEIIEPETLYFPPMLSLRKLNNLNDTLEYHEKLSNLFYKDYFVTIDEGNFDGKIKTGQEVYSDMKKLLLSLDVSRKVFFDYENYISEKFFGNKKISIFIEDEKKDISIKEDNEQPYPIYNLGDGLQTLIILTYYLYMHQNEPLKVFIDEPEIHLHPGLQRLLIEVLQDKQYKNIQFFISTHSSNIIDICDKYDSNTSIICVEKIDGKKIVYNSAYDDMDLHKLIGIRPSSIILSNCTIWVEGPTDIYYIDTYLKLYYNRIKDENGNGNKAENKNESGFSIGYNYNYAFNGSINIASKFDFTNDKTAAMKVNKLSRNNYMIFDSDNLCEEDANYQNIEAFRKQLSDSNRCHVVKKLRTIENIIPPFILKEFFDKNYYPTTKEIKSIVLEYFDALNLKYGTDEYYKINHAEGLSNSVSERIKTISSAKLKNSLSKYDKEYFRNMWNHKKVDMATFFSDRIEKMSDDEKTNLYENTLIEFTKMIEDIYKFIAENNK